MNECLPLAVASAVLALVVLGVTWAGNAVLDIRARRAIPKLRRGERVPYRVERRAKEIDGTPEMCDGHQWHATGAWGWIYLSRQRVLRPSTFHCPDCRRIGERVGDYILPARVATSWDNDCAGCAPEKYRVSPSVPLPIEDPMSFTRWLFR